MANPRPFAPRAQGGQSKAGVSDNRRNRNHGSLRFAPKLVRERVLNRGSLREHLALAQDDANCGSSFLYLQQLSYPSRARAARAGAASSITSSCRSDSVIGDGQTRSGDCDRHLLESEGAAPEDTGLPFIEVALSIHILIFQLQQPRQGL